MLFTYEIKNKKLIDKSSSAYCRWRKCNEIIDTQGKNENNERKEKRIEHKLGHWWHMELEELFVL